MSKQDTYSWESMGLKKKPIKKNCPFSHELLIQILDILDKRFAGKGLCLVVQKEKHRKAGPASTGLGGD